MEIAPFLLSQLSKQYSEADISRILSGYESRRKTSLRINPLKKEDTNIRKLLKAQGLAFENIPWYTDALVLDAEMESVIQRLPVYEGGIIYLQNLSSMIPPLLLDAKPGDNVLDMAAAPGGKTTEIAALTNNLAMITACERDAGRAKRLEYNLARQGAKRVTVMIRDARTLDDFFRFDRILLDAPCSGSGTVNHRSKGVFSEDNIRKTTKLQRDLLDKAVRLLPRGKEMVYSTCSILEAENEAILMRLIRSGTLRVVPLDEERFADVPKLPTSIPGTLCVCPDECYEGFFAAKLMKI